MSRDTELHLRNIILRATLNFGHEIWILNQEESKKITHELYSDNCEVSLG
jgi:hypothetical protein